MRVAERVYHTIALHTQKDSRMSYSNPPLATIPPDLREIYKPDPGWPWVEYDYDQVELRLHAAYAGDKPFLEALAKGYDVHLMTACTIFHIPLPPVLIDPFKVPENAAWRAEYHFIDKDDPRRHFGKTMQHRLCKGGKPEESGSIPSAKTLNLKKADLVKAAQTWMAAHPAIAAYHQRLREKILKTCETRTWAGRRRKYLGKVDKIPNEALAHPDQAGTQDIANAVIIEIKETFGEDVYYVKGNHDSQTWGVREEKAEEIEEGIKVIAQRPRRVNGLEIPFPATFKPRRYA